MISINSFIFSLLVSLPIAFAADPPCDPTNPLTPVDICNVRASFGGGIVPQIIPSFTPTGLLMVTYGTVTLGGAQQMSPSRVNTAPVVALSQVPGTKMGPSYTLVMFDGTSKELTWLETDLQAQPTTGNLVSNTPPLVSYQSPNPAANTGLHNFVILLYTQTGSVTVPSLTGFDINDFVTKNFPGATSPAAGMFFRSQYDGIAFSSQGAQVVAATATTSTTVAPVATTSTSSGKVTTTSSTKLVKVTTSNTSSSGTSTSTSTSNSNSPNPVSNNGSGNGGGQINSAGKNFGYSGFVFVGLLSLFSSLML